MGKPFTTELWESIAPIYQAILDHPFIRGLTDGSLPEPNFQHFITTSRYEGMFWDAAWRLEAWPVG